MASTNSTVIYLDLLTSYYSFIQYAHIYLSTQPKSNTCINHIIFIKNFIQYNLVYHAAVIDSLTINHFPFFRQLNTTITHKIEKDYF